MPCINNRAWPHAGCEHTQRQQHQACTITYAIGCTCRSPGAPRMTVRVTAICDVGPADIVNIYVHANQFELCSSSSSSSSDLASGSSMQLTCWLTLARCWQVGSRQLSDNFSFAHRVASCILHLTCCILHLAYDMFHFNFGFYPREGRYTVVVVASAG